VAAPTAGLHFTPALFERLAAGGVAETRVTLHVGPGTFQPVRDDDYTAHQMLAEWYEVPAAAAAAITAHRPPRGRVVAVGTTTVRAMEWAAREDGVVRPGAGETRLFVTPGYTFRTVDALVTNFHLPGSTLLLLVAAFAGRDLLLEAYRRAVAERYRFYSYGDAMLIL
jgi:S-adenosylmethionine:tRNA ribosyltransferase-isomerase